MLNSTERIEYCLKIEKELYTIKIFRYMKLISETLNMKINIIICINIWYEYKQLYLMKHLYGGVHIM